MVPQKICKARIKKTMERGRCRQTQEKQKVLKERSCLTWVMQEMKERLSEEE